MEEIEPQNKVQFEKRYDELVKIIESFERLEKSKEWEILKEYIFSKSLISLEKQLLVAARSNPVDLPKVYVLQGELIWARRYHDISKLIEMYKKQLIDIKSKIQ